MNTSDAPSMMLMTRRAALCGTVATSALLLLSCSPSGSGREGGQETAAESRAPTPASSPAMTVFRDPSCGCCESWAAIARRAGYNVDVRDHRDMPSVKRRLGVPEQLASCHTTQVSGWVIEGHVPLEYVARLLRERPQGIRGIAVPGMPVGSPGMEIPDGRTEPFEVIAFDAAGNTSVLSG